jgi:hypothetical protein
LAELYSPSKRTKIKNKINYFENDGLSDLAKLVCGLPECSELETTKLVGKFENK